MRAQLPQIKLHLGPQLRPRTIRYAPLNEPAQGATRIAGHSPRHCTRSASRVMMMTTSSTSSSRESHWRRHATPAWRTGSRHAAIIAGSEQEDIDVYAQQLFSPQHVRLHSECTQEAGCRAGRCRLWACSCCRCAARLLDKRRATRLQQDKEAHCLQWLHGRQMSRRSGNSCSRTG